MVTHSLTMATSAAIGAIPSGALDRTVASDLALASAAAIVVLFVVALAERLHARRVRRVARLAFGPRGRPARWALAVPAIRVVAAALATWGLVFLAGYDAVEIDSTPRREASMHLLICLDVSPSMQIKDAGPEVEKLTRAAWAGRIVQGVLDRLDMASTRITIVAFYTDALPIVKETFDKEVVRNALDGLPMYVAFKPGPTDLQKGLATAFDLAKPWPAGSATLLVVSDGDASHAIPPALPSAIADAIVIGVGNPSLGTLVSGHSSRQDRPSLQQLAVRLGGEYHEGNTKHLPSEVLERLTMLSPRSGGRVSWRDLALLSAGAGCFALALAGPALLLFGRPRAFAAARRAVATQGKLAGEVD